MSIKNKEFRNLSRRDRMCTVFHTWVNFLPGKNPLISMNEVYYVLEMIGVLAEKFGCYIFAAAVLDNHIHIVIGCRKGPKDISKFWLSLKMVIVNLARSKNMSGTLFSNRAQFRAILDVYALLVAIRYVHNNGKNDGHFVKGTLENEYRFKKFVIINPYIVELFTSLNPEEMRLLLFCAAEELPSAAKRFESEFRKKNHMFSVTESIAS